MYERSLGGKTPRDSLANLVWGADGRLPITVRCPLQMSILVRRFLVHAIARLTVRLKRAVEGGKQIQPAPGLEKFLGQVVREIRQERDISQDRLAREMGTDRTTISLIERGLRSPYVRTLLQIASCLGVKPSEFFRRLELRMGDNWRSICGESRKQRNGRDA